MSDVDNFDRPALRSIVPAGEAAALFEADKRPPSSVFALGQLQSDGHGFNTSSADADRESGATGGHLRRESARSERCLKDLGQVTRQGLGWVTPAVDSPSDEGDEAEDLRTALWNDGTLEIADGDTRMLLSPEKAKQLFEYTDLVRHVGRFAE